MKYKINFNETNNIYDTMDKFIQEQEQIMVQARTNCAKNGLKKKNVMAIFNHCFSVLGNNEKKIKHYLSYKEKEANKTKYRNNKHKSVYVIAREHQEAQIVKYYIKHNIGDAMSKLANPYTAENMF